MSSRESRPAILGGLPVRPSGPPLWPRQDESVREVLRSMIETGDWGRYHGPHLPNLCRQLAEFHSVEHALVCSSGTAAVELALRGVGVVEGDDVILAAYDFKANFQNVLTLGAVPVLVDLDPVTCQLDPNQLPMAFSPKTRAILISHLHGGIVDVTQVRQFADAHQIAIVEDACQSHGADVYGRRAGTWGDVGVLSFGGSKLLTAGRGGAIVTSRTEIFERIKRYAHRGNDAYPLSEIQAALLVPQLKQLDACNAHRRAAVGRLESGLRNAPGLTMLQSPQSPHGHVYYKVGFHYNASEFRGLSRERFVAAMRAEGIAVDAGFRGNHLIHASRRFRGVGGLPVATRADSDIVTVHHPILLEDESAIDEIVSAVCKVRDYASEIARLDEPAIEDA